MIPIALSQCKDEVEVLVVSTDDIMAFFPHPMAPNILVSPRLPRPAGSLTKKAPMSETRKRILCIEDDRETASLIAEELAERGYDVARRVRSGSLTINGLIVDPKMPFGGFKQSGLGREGGIEGLDPYLETKTIYFA